MANSKKFSLTLADVLQRAAQASGKSQDADLGRWLGVSKSSMNNWKVRGTIPYKSVVPALVEHRVSLDWFFAPDVAFRRPTIDYDKILAAGPSGIAEKLSDIPSIVEHLTHVLQERGALVNERNLNYLYAVYTAVHDASERERAIHGLATVLADDEGMA
ncbi:helix-turn-helix domain-containing protein [Aliidiomarina sanyensis]|uniref:Bacteriophage CI repressor N-terminal domain-containing protein n=1 Tax=Aliidiomarina sanyensis TaxID=1249555 RepID=A0A432WEX0_9GAMM|nr:helix-turn-helix domain-containing protein [Aliidiomarina sanyensis]RUO31406.1 hypothetical protein CWE11_08725 [Aliidiomarina sanyensis]